LNVWYTGITIPTEQLHEWEKNQVNYYHLLASNDEKQGETIDSGYPKPKTGILHRHLEQKIIYTLSTKRDIYQHGCQNENHTYQTSINQNSPCCSYYNVRSKWAKK
jgi:hypothetical protein